MNTDLKFCSPSVFITYRSNDSRKARKAMRWCSQNIEDDLMWDIEFNQDREAYELFFKHHKHMSWFILQNPELIENDRKI